jgi:hypothetical protein
MATRPRPPSIIVPAATLLAGYPTGATWAAANRAQFSRFAVSTPTPVRYFNHEIITASGNYQYGVVRLSGADFSDWTKVVASAVTAAVAGVLRGDLGAFTLTPGDYALFMWADNTTISTRRATSVQSARVAGSSSATLYPGGVPDSGTFTWGTTNFMAGLSLER